MKNFDPRPFTLRASAIRPFIYCLLVLIHILFTLSSCGKDDTCTEKKWYQNFDGDPEGNNEVTLLSCTRPDGYIDVGGDPDDTNPNITSDCEQVTYYADEDEDDYGDPNNFITQCSGVDIPANYVANATDCDDTNADIKPNTVYYQDNDGDGLGNPIVSQEHCGIPEGYVADNTDCNDDLDPADLVGWEGTYSVEDTNNPYFSLYNVEVNLINAETENGLAEFEIVNYGGYEGSNLERSVNCFFDPCTQTLEVPDQDLNLTVGDGNLHSEGTGSFYIEDGQPVIIIANRTFDDGGTVFEGDMVFEKQLQ